MCCRVGDWNLEETVNKGILWAYFASAQTLVVTTHMTGAAAPGTDGRQMDQVRAADPCVRCDAL